MHEAQHTMTDLRRLHLEIKSESSLIPAAQGHTYVTDFAGHFLRKKSTSQVQKKS